MTKSLFTIIFLVLTTDLIAQIDPSQVETKERLDFAKGYFELGGTYFPSTVGKQMENNRITNFEHGQSLNSTLYWGGFHFWGKAEFYVSFPLRKLDLQESSSGEINFMHYAVTGARFYPWRVEEKKVRPFVGLSWAAFDYQQKDADGNEAPRWQKNIELGLDAGLIYHYKSFALRASAFYHPNNRWEYPISRTVFETIKTPGYGISVGLIYTKDYSKDNGDPRLNERWNKYRRISPLGAGARYFGDLFIGLGPSLSFSLDHPQYNQTHLPFLNPRQSSESYFDISLGYHFNTANIFTALTFRNPTFERSGYGTRQHISKSSLTLEVAKFLVDYTGFAPFIGLNLAYDQIDYLEEDGGQISQDLTIRQFEPGITFGWDIVPGKTDEYLILRTNLRWYPLSSFSIDDEKFDFGQLEYNLIQVLFYPERFFRSKKT